MIYLQNSIVHAVEVFRGIFFIVQDNLGSFDIRSSQFAKGRFFGSVIQLFTAEDGIHTLNGTDTDLRTGRNIGTLQSGDAIQLCKRTRIIIWMIGQEFTLSLFAEAFRMDQMLPQMMQEQGVTEDLKRRDQLAWVGAMNNIHAQIEEIILTELVYT